MNDHAIRITLSYAARGGYRDGGEGGMIPRVCKPAARKRANK